MRSELRDSLDNLYADERVGRRPVCSLAVDVAQGGIAAVHVLVDDLSGGDSLRLAVKCKGRSVRGAKWFRLHPVPVEENTGLIGFTVGMKVMREPPLPVEPNAPNPWVARRAPFRIFDALEPIGSRMRADKPVTALRLHLPIERDARPGLREYVIELSHGSAAAMLVLDVNIYKTLLPRAGIDTVPYTNWFDYEGIAKRHGLKLWSDAYWSMLRRYATLMAHARQNTFWIPLSLIFSRTRQGLVLNRPRVRRIVKTFTDAGLYFIEGGHVAHRRNFTDATYFLFVTEAAATSVQGHTDLSVVCAQLREEIERQGWRDRWVQHVADEPTPCNAADYRILTGMVRKHLPGIPLLDALEDPTMAGAVDIWCPKVQEYQRQRKTYEAYRATGDRVWCYTCCFPGGPWLNRLLDQELLRPALLGWGMALFQLDGYLHWGLNHYGPHQDPFKQSVLPRKDWENKPGGTLPGSLPAGDTHIVYPGPQGPWSSLRLEAQREGFEDFELLRALRAKSPAQAAAVLRPVITGFDRYIKDVRRFRIARRMLYRALSV